MPKQPMPLRLNEQAADETLTDLEVSNTAGIQEKKLALDHSTQDLYANSVRVDEDRRIISGVNLILDWIILVDQVTGDKYKVTLQNAEMVFTKVDL